MKRLLFNFLCTGSLFLFLTTAILWILSYSLREELDWKRLRPQPPRIAFVDYHIAWSSGLLDLGKQARGPLPRQPETPGLFSYRLPPTANLIEPHTPLDRMNLQLGAFQLTHTVNFQGPARYSTHDLVLPLWIFLPLSAIPLLLWWRRKRSRPLAGNSPPTTGDVAPSP